MKICFLLGNSAIKYSFNFLQGHYQSAREFLIEAHSAGVSFSDIPLQARALYLLGTLSYEEAQFGQAINYCQKAQVSNVYTFLYCHPIVLGTNKFSDLVLHKTMFI